MEKQKRRDPYDNKNNQHWNDYYDKGGRKGHQKRGDGKKIPGAKTTRTRGAKRTPGAKRRRTAGILLDLGRIGARLQRPGEHRKDPRDVTMGRGIPAKDREEMPERPERGERRAGRRAMKGPGRLEERTEERAEVRAEVRTEERAEERTEERTEETAVARVREDGWPKRGWLAAKGWTNGGVRIRPRKTSTSSMWL